MPPPPSPASSTCSDGSISSPAVGGGGRRQKRSAPKEDPEKVDEEEWNLKDVIFVEDSRNIPVGRVIKVDGPYVAVRFPQTNSGSANKDNKDNNEENLINDNIRLLRTEDLQVLKTGLMPRIPDCFQRAPKKVSLQADGQVLAITVDGQGIHAVIRSNSGQGKMSHKVFNISSGKVEVDSKFPTDTSAFLGLNSEGIRFRSTGESEFVSLLLDGNGTVYPMVKDSTPSADSIKDPYWLDLLPVSAIGLGTHALPHVGSGKKNEVAVIVMSFMPQFILPKILQCDLESVKRLLANLEADPTADTTIELIQRILEERCDGGRNILHTAVSMCQPNSNKDRDQESSSSASAQLEPMESIANSFSSRALNLRDMMRRAAAASGYVSSRRHELASAASGSSGSAPAASSSAASMAASVAAAAAAASNVIVGPPGAGSSDLDDPAGLPWAQPADAILDAAAGPAGAEDDSLLGVPSGSKTPKESSATASKPTYANEGQERRAHALALLKLICNSTVFQPHLEALLALTDAQGNTPFMAAVVCRAYPAALVLFEAAQRVAEESSDHKDTQRKTFMSMIYPPSTNEDSSPLHVICCNDTCSFTWTGAEHINQDIFECRTCGLTDSLCCCTECARVCHKGHDCKLKRTSPTAYCDCWEKCKCKSLIAGNQNARFDVLCKLISDTDLVTMCNGRGENILLFLAQVRELW
jgi:E3 ubiquitin-protein ligase EDD1